VSLDSKKRCKAKRAFKFNEAYQLLLELYGVLHYHEENAGYELLNYEGIFFFWFEVLLSANVADNSIFQM